MTKVRIFLLQDHKGWQIVGGSEISSNAEALGYLDTSHEETSTITSLEVELPEWTCPSCAGDRTLRVICPSCSGNGCRTCHGIGEMEFTCPCQE